MACALSLGSGTRAGYFGTGVTRHVNIRSGQITPLVLPWPRLAVGFGIAFALCLLAASAPRPGSAGRKSSPSCDRAVPPPERIEQIRDPR